MATTTSLREMVKRVRPSVVRIESGSSTGSGVIFKAEGGMGYIVTNHHVVGDNRSVRVTVNDSTPYTGEVIGSEERQDIAVVRICWGDFQAIPFGDSSMLEAGDEVAALGYPLGLSGEATLSNGIVSKMDYNSGYHSEVIQTNADINPGNSGGPMLSISGEILGINASGIERTTSGRPVGGINFAISEMVVQRCISKILNASTDILIPRRRDSFGPVGGDLWHDEKSVTSGWANVLVDDAVIEATFVNPYSAATSRWDYGFTFRWRRRQDSNFLFFRVSVTSERTWQVSARRQESNKNQDIQVGRGDINFTFNTNAGGQNHLRVVAIGERGWLFVNGEFIASFDASAISTSGDVTVSTGFSRATIAVGSVVRVHDFRVTKFEERVGPVDGKLEWIPENWNEHDCGIAAKNLAVEAEFSNPGNASWSYGFAFRNQNWETTEVIQLDYDREWIHSTRGAGEDDYTQKSSGILLEEVFRATNRLTLFAVEEAGWFFVNEQLVAKLDLSHNQSRGSISAMCYSYRNETGEQEFEKFTVWPIR